jgi:tetratricopeptide (TPR) repeat protein
MTDWSYYNQIGWLALQRGELNLAERRFRNAIATVRPHGTNGRILMGRSYGDLAWVLYRQGRYGESEPLANWSLSVRETQTNPNPESVSQGLYLLAVIHHAQKHLTRAEGFLKRSLEILELAHSVDNPSTAVIVDELAVVESELGKFDEAEPLFKRALVIRGRSNPSTNLELAATLDRYVTYLRRIHREEETPEFMRQAKAIRDTVADTELKARAHSRRAVSEASH